MTTPKTNYVNVFSIGEKHEGGNVEGVYANMDDAKDALNSALENYLVRGWKKHQCTDECVLTDVRFVHVEGCNFFEVTKYEVE